jgi:hypothetical protein
MSVLLLEYNGSRERLKVLPAGLLVPGAVKTFGAEEKTSVMVSMAWAGARCR